MTSIATVVTIRASQRAPLNRFIGGQAPHFLHTVQAGRAVFSDLLLGLTRIGHQREVTEVVRAAQQWGHVTIARAIFEPTVLPLQLQRMGAIPTIGFTDLWAASRVLEATGPTRITARGPANSSRAPEEIQFPVAAGATTYAACLGHPTPREVRSRIPPRSTAG